MLVTDIQDPYSVELVRGVEDMRQRHGYLLVLCNSSEDPSRECQYVDGLCAEPVAGAIVVPTSDRRPVLQTFRERNIPVISVDRRVRDRSVDAVLIDYVSPAREAGAHLISNGYRRIGLITGPHGTTTARERLEGYPLAVRDGGIPRDPRLVQQGPLAV